MQGAKTGEYLSCSRNSRRNKTLKKTRQKRNKQKINSRRPVWLAQIDPGGE